MQKLTINATILDAIERVQFFFDYLAEIPSKKKTLEYDLDETSVIDVKNLLLQHYPNDCHFENNSLFVTRPLSAEEIAEEIEDYQDRIEYWIERIVKWSENEKYRLQINNYLDKHNIKYEQLIKRMAAK